MIGNVRRILSLKRLKEKWRFERWLNSSRYKEKLIRVKECKYKYYYLYNNNIYFKNV